MNTPSVSATVPSIEPHLSVVVTTRNDDHGGDPLKRLQAFVNCFDEQCRRTGLDAEVIVVEWNPPADRPKLDTLLRLPQPGFCTYRFLDVPPELHDGLQYSDVLPLFQMIAKNVGIRRARGRFVLATNIDIIFSNELIEYIASGQLQPGFMYRVDRHDIESALPVHAPLDVQMKYCAEHQLRIHGSWGSCAVDPRGQPVALSEDIVDGSTVRLGSGWHVREGDAATGFYRWVTGRAQVQVEPPAAALTPAGVSLEIEFEPNPHDPTSPVQIEIIDDDGRTMARPTISRRGVFRLPLPTDGASRTLELRVRSAPSDGRRPLAVFERRGDMQYLVRSIKQTSLDQTHDREAFVYPSDGWQAIPNARLEPEHIGGDLSVVSAAQRWSYCLQYGPLVARRSGTYRFVVLAEIREGGLSLGVMTGHQRSWLPSSPDYVSTTRGEILGVSVSLESGARFWLMLSNDHPRGEGISRFVVKELTGSGELGRAIGASKGHRVRRSDARASESDEVRSEAPGPNELPADRSEPAVPPQGSVVGLVATRSPRVAQTLHALVGWPRRDEPAQAQDVPASGGPADGDGATLRAEHGDAGMSASELSDGKGEQLLGAVNGAAGYADTRSPRAAQALLARIERRRHDKQVRVQHALQFSAKNWRAGSDGATLRVEYGDDGVSVVTERRKWSYCLEYGPLSAVATGTHRFDLDCHVFEGGARLGILSGDKQSWLPSEGTETILRDDDRTLTVSARLRSGQAFWLVLYNDHPDGDGESRLLVRRVSVTVDVRDALAIAGRLIERTFVPPHDPNVIVTPPAPAAYAMDRWHAVHSPAPDALEHVDGRISVTTAKERWSYCVEYGPMRAAATGRYQFTLKYELTEGAIALGVLDGDKTQWLSSSSQSAVTPEGHTLTTAANLKAGRLFWLMISNDHPDGDLPSRFTMRALASAGDVLARRVKWSRLIRRAFRPGAVRDAVVAPQDPAVYAMNEWRAADSRSPAQLQRIDGRMLATTAPEKWSYCLEYGPMRAAASGTYQFALTYRLTAGGIVLGVLNGDRKKWLRSSVHEAITSDLRTVTVGVQLKAGRLFWLIISNNHPDGEGISRFTVEGLTSAVVPASRREQWRLLRRAFRPGAVRHVVVAPQDPAVYAMNEWRAADSRSPAQLQRIDGRMLATTAPEKWSYCLEYGPMRAAASGTYQFALTYRLTAGDIILGVLNGDRKKWLRSSVYEAITSDLRTVTVGVQLKAGRLFWLIISNNHPDGEGISRFMVEGLTSTFVPASRRERWLRMIRELWEFLASRVNAVRRRTLETLAASARGLSGLGPLASLRTKAVRIRDGVRRRIVHSAPEYKAVQNNYRALEETVQQLARLRDLDGMLKLLQDRRPEALHLNGCGDFQLMAREHWFELRGYPEFHTFSMNIDGLFSNIACYAGIVERALQSPCHIYHIEHEVGLGWTPEGEAVLRRRIAERGITWIDSRDVFVWSAYMHWLRRPMIFNTSDWGFGACTLGERRSTSAGT